MRLKTGAKTARVDQPLLGGASSLPDWAVVEMVVQKSKSQGGVPIVPGGNHGLIGLGHWNWYDLTTV